MTIRRHQTGLKTVRAVLARARQALAGLIPEKPREAAGTALPRGFWIFLAVFAAGMLLVSLVGDQGLIAYWKLHGEAEALRGEIATMEARKSELARVIQALQDDPYYIEQIARQELGLVRPDEVVLQIPPMTPREAGD